MIFRFIVPLLFLSAAFGSSVEAKPKLKVVSSIPDLSWVVSEIGKDRVDAVALLRGTENPHYIDAVPEFVRIMASADVACIVGLDLEVGWIPPVLARSGNAKVQPGGMGYCETGKAVSALDKPTGPVDRSMGDVHPHGNPHFYLSPTALGHAATVMTQTLKNVDPLHAGFYEKNLVAFQSAMKNLTAKIHKKLEPVRQVQAASGRPLVIEYHREFTYFFAEYGLDSLGAVEEKPGVPPSAGRIGTLAQSMRAAGVRLILAADYSPTGALERLSEMSGAKLLRLPTMMQARGINDYEGLQEHLAKLVLDHATTDARSLVR
jgi:zinc/manganese transport system substrate-binding protein